LIEPDVQISRIRLSDKTSRLSGDQSAEDLAKKCDPVASQDDRRGTGFRASNTPLGIKSNSFALPTTPICAGTTAARSLSVNHPTIGHFNARLPIS
jgi:hypothetical protein